MPIKNDGDIKEAEIIEEPEALETEIVDPKIVLEPDEGVLVPVRVSSKKVVQLTFDGW